MNPIRLETGIQCLVFSTNVNNNLKAARLAYILERDHEIKDWNLDMEDHDHVLRIDFKSLNLDILKKQLSAFDVTIKELPIW